MLEDTISFIKDNYQQSRLDVISKEIIDSIDSSLKASGIMYRLFSRVKSEESVCKKIEKKYEKYVSTGTKMQDSIGLRITLYFKDDIDICIRILKGLFDEDNHECDEIDSVTFKPLRINYVFRIPSSIGKIPSDYQESGLIDNSFEVQVRTTFTEGWQEVEHDIRYKYQTDWNDEVDMSRDLNALAAILEMCDNNIIGICDNLSYKKYKAKKVEPMIRSRFRIRLDPQPLDQRLNDIILSDYERIGKAIFRFNRERLIWSLSKCHLDVNVNNIIFLINRLGINHKEISALDSLSEESIPNEVLYATDFSTSDPYNSIVAMKYN